MKKILLTAFFAFHLMSFEANAQMSPAPASSDIPPSIQSPAQATPPSDLNAPSYTQQPPSYAPPAQPQPAYTQPPVAYVQPVAAAPYCQPYTDTISIGGQSRFSSGTACLHPDGSWELHPAQVGINYITRGGVVYMIPTQPIATVVVAPDHPHHHRDW